MNPVHFSIAKITAEIAENAEGIYSHPPLLNFLDRIRDEAHRFAIRYHAKLRGRGAVRSILSEIPGMGPGRQKILLDFFGSVERIKKATVEELTQSPGVSLPTARRIHDFFTSR